MERYTYAGHTIEIRNHSNGFEATASGPAIRKPIVRTTGSLIGAKAEAERAIRQSLEEVARHPEEEDAH